jgi:hypothetical protein
MIRRTLIVAAALALASTHASALPASPPQDGPSAAAAAAQSSSIAAGEVAPDFQFQAFDYRWLQLHDLLAQGNVLLVIAPSESKLRTLQRERMDLVERGVIPVAVLDLRDGPAWSMTNRLGLSYSLLSDPRNEIATAFRVARATAGPEPSWFMIGREGRVLASGPDLAGIESYSGLACSALGLPAPDATVASTK